MATNESSLTAAGSHYATTADVSTFSLEVSQARSEAWQNRRKQRLLQVREQERAAAKQALERRREAERRRNEVEELKYHQAKADELNAAILKLEQEEIHTVQRMGSAYTAAEEVVSESISTRESELSRAASEEQKTRKRYRAAVHAMRRQAEDMARPVEERMALKQKVLDMERQRQEQVLRDWKHRRAHEGTGHPLVETQDAGTHPKMVPVTSTVDQQAGFVNTYYHRLGDHILVDGVPQPHYTRRGPGAIPVNTREMEHERAMLNNAYEGAAQLQQAKMNAQNERLRKRKELRKRELERYREAHMHLQAENDRILLEKNLEELARRDRREQKQHMMEDIRSGMHITAGGSHPGRQRQLRQARQTELEKAFESEFFEAAEEEGRKRSYRPRKRFPDGDGDDGNAFWKPPGSGRDDGDDGGDDIPQFHATGTLTPKVAPRQPDGGDVPFQDPRMSDYSSEAPQVSRDESEEPKQAGSQPHTVTNKDKGKSPEKPAESGDPSKGASADLAQPQMSLSQLSPIAASTSDLSVPAAPPRPATLPSKPPPPKDESETDALIASIQDFKERLALGDDGNPPSQFTTENLEEVETSMETLHDNSTGGRPEPPPPTGLSKEKAPLDDPALLDASTYWTYPKVDFREHERQVAMARIGKEPMSSTEIRRLLAGDNDGEQDDLEALEARNGSTLSRLAQESYVQEKLAQNERNIFIPCNDDDDAEEPSDLHRAMEDVFKMRTQTLERLETEAISASVEQRQRNNGFGCMASVDAAVDNLKQLDEQTNRLLDDSENIGRPRDTAEGTMRTPLKDRNQNQPDTPQTTDKLLEDLRRLRNRVIPNTPHASPLRNVYGGANPTAVQKRLANEKKAKEHEASIKVQGDLQRQFQEKMTRFVAARERREKAKSRHLRDGDSSVGAATTSTQPATVHHQQFVGDWTPLEGPEERFGANRGPMTRQEMLDVNRRLRERAARKTRSLSSVHKPLTGEQELARKQERRRQMMAYGEYTRKAALAKQRDLSSKDMYGSLTDFRRPTRD